MPTPKITAVICTHNRASMLERSVRSVLAQTLPENQYEVLVVDNASDDDTAEACRQWASEGIKYSFEPVLGLSAARNTGWKNAQGTYVGYLDDDAVAAPGWLESALLAFEDVAPQPSWVGGPIDLDWENPPPPWLDADLHESLGHLDWGTRPRWLGAHERLGGGNSFYPRSLLEKVGGFDSRLGRRGNLLLSGEETQLQRRIEATGGRLYYHPGIRIRHHVPANRLTPAFFYRRYYWGGFTDFVIRRTLGAAGRGEDLPSAQDTRRMDPLARAARLTGQVVSAAGLSRAPVRVVRGRTHVAYVAGVAAGWAWWTTHPAARAEVR